MERNELGQSSKKRRVTNSRSAKYAENIFYRLYFKGLIRNDIAVEHSRRNTGMAGFGVAICSETDELLFQIKEPVNNANVNSEVIQMRALIRGLSESLNLGIRKLVICCDDNNEQIYKNIKTGNFFNPEQEKFAQKHMEEVQRLIEKFDYTESILVDPINIRFAFELAREAIVSQTSSASEVKREICVICDQEETEANRMFVNDKCLHCHCYSCVNQFVEVKLRDGAAPTCLNYECQLELTLENCSKALKPKVIELWKHKMEEDSIPLSERIYCPYQNCSKLMSKTGISRSDDQSNNGACVKCSGLFCIECKVPSHSGLSCAEYKKDNPDPLVDDLKLKSLAKEQNWRQCVNCRHLIELSQGCNHMICRCGYQFCYKCGVKWEYGQKSCPTGCRVLPYFLHFRRRMGIRRFGI